MAGLAWEIAVMPSGSSVWEESSRWFILRL
jgi:hypothetical protein